MDGVGERPHPSVGVVPAAPHKPLFDRRSVTDPDEPEVRAPVEQRQLPVTGHHRSPGRDQGHRLGVGAAGLTVAGDGPSAGGLPGHVEVDEVARDAGRQVDEGLAAEILQRHRAPVGEPVPGGQHQETGAAGDHRAHRQVRIVHRERGQQQVGAPVPQLLRVLVQLRLDHPDRAARVAVLEDLAGGVHHPPVLRAHEAHGERAGDTAARQLGASQRPPDALPQGLQIVPQALPDGGQRHPAGAAFEQRGADPPLDPLHRPADQPRGDVQPLGGAAEVQLLAERQERLHLGAFHRRTPPGLSDRWT